ncbi:MAG: winged helix-turn-helix domain-containing protein [candidate division WOR-3 bacterium]
MNFLLKLFKGLANKTRLRMIEILLDKKALTADDFSEILNIPRVTACRNLKILEREDLIKGERINVQVYYSLNRDKNRPYNAALIALIKKKKAGG